MRLNNVFGWDKNKVHNNNAHKNLEKVINGYDEGALDLVIQNVHIKGNDVATSSIYTGKQVEKFQGVKDIPEELRMLIEKEVEEKLDKQYSKALQEYKDEVDKEYWKLANELAKKKDEELRCKNQEIEDLIQKQKTSFDRSAWGIEISSDEELNVKKTFEIQMSTANRLKGFKKQMRSLGYTTTMNKMVDQAIQVYLQLGIRSTLTKINGNIEIQGSDIL
jgi:hypothetical protein